MSRIFSALHHAWLFINWLFSEEVHISLHVLKRPWEPSEVGARKGNTCYSCVGSCAPTESEARRARRVSWLGLDLARQGWLACWGWRPSRTGTSCPASQVPASATAPFLDNYFNKIEFGSAFCQINMFCIQTWRSFLHARNVRIRPTAGGIKSFVRVLLMLLTWNLVYLVFDCFCGHWVQSSVWIVLPFLILRLKNSQQAGQLASPSGRYEWQAPPLHPPPNIHTRITVFKLSIKSLRFF